MPALPLVRINIPIRAASLFLPLMKHQGREKPSFPGEEGEKRRVEPGREITHACGLSFLRAKSGIRLVFSRPARYNDGV